MSATTARAGSDDAHVPHGRLAELLRQLRPARARATPPIRPRSSSTTAFGAADYRERLARADAREPDEPLSLYVHLPFCERALHLLRLPRRRSPRSHEVAARYLGYLRARDRRWSPSACRGAARSCSIHWGGGTPTYLTPDAAAAAARRASRATSTSLPDAEVAIEVDPRVTTRRAAATAARARLQPALDGRPGLHARGAGGDRPRTRPSSRRATSSRLARERRLPQSINIDLIYGLPCQTAATFGATLDRLIELRPDRVAVYSFAYVPWIRPHQKQIDAATLPAARSEARALPLAASTASSTPATSRSAWTTSRCPGDELAPRRARRPRCTATSWATRCARPPT